MIYINKATLTPAKTNAAFIHNEFIIKQKGIVGKRR